MTLCDTGILVDLVGADTKKALACQRVIQRAAKPLITTWPCISEAMHLLGKYGGWSFQNRLACLVEGPLLIVHNIHSDDCSHLFRLMAKYQDRPMDIADASLVLIAAKTGERKILTLDSDFLFYRINNRDSFEIINI